MAGPGQARLGWARVRATQITRAQNKTLERGKSGQGRAGPGEARRGAARRCLARVQVTKFSQHEKKIMELKEITRETIEGWEKTRPALKALNDATLDKPRGFAIAVVECHRLAGGEERFKKVARYWRLSVMWLTGITIEYEAGSKAYQFIEVERHLTHRHHRMMKAIEKKHRQEWQRLGVMRDKDMSDHQRKVRMMAMDQHTRSAGIANANREHHRIALTTPETLPQIAKHS